MKRDKILVLDFGSQYAHLIAKRLRLQGYYSEIALPSAPTELLSQARGLVLSGGPASVYDEKIPACNPDLWDLPVPILGLCYGHQLMAITYKGRVERAERGEFGIAALSRAQTESPLFEGIEFPAQVWMSHQDEVTVPPPGFDTIARTEACPYAALQDLSRRRFSLQFHAEVKDTPCGNQLFENFARLCGMGKNWDRDAVLNHIIQSIQKDARDKKVLLYLSGGVDSSVAFALLNRALGTERVLGLHIDNGFMRKNESAEIARRYREAGFSNFICEDASEGFLRAMGEHIDPQEKRKAVGEYFITVRNEVALRYGLNQSDWLLAQGTLYPDIIESGGSEHAHTIKTHHNRVEGIQKLIAQGLIIEPLKDLYKDEVRRIGSALGLKDELIMRHPFPGPGLSINVLCHTGVLTEADTKEAEEAERTLASLVSSSSPFVKLKTTVLPLRSVGVQGDFRTYRFPAVLAFDADAEGFSLNIPDWDSLETFSSHITNSLPLLNRAVLSLFTRPNTKLALQKGFCTKFRLDQTREADAIVIRILHESGYYHRIFQHLTIHLPYASQEAHCAIVLRPVVSEDVMTARFAHLDTELLSSIVKEIAALPFCDAIYYDITNKPPATFGWE